MMAGYSKLLWQLLQVFSASWCLHSPCWTCWPLSWVLSLLSQTSGVYPAYCHLRIVFDDFQCLQLRVLLVDVTLIGPSLFTFFVPLILWKLLFGIWQHQSFFEWNLFCIFTLLYEWVICINNYQHCKLFVCVNFILLWSTTLDWLARISTIVALIIRCSHLMMCAMR